METLFARPFPPTSLPQRTEADAVCKAGVTLRGGPLPLDALRPGHELASGCPDGMDLATVLTNRTDMVGPIPIVTQDIGPAPLRPPDWPAHRGRRLGVFARNLNPPQH